MWLWHYLDFRKGAKHPQYLKNSAACLQDIMIEQEQPMGTKVMKQKAGLVYREESGCWRFTSLDTLDIIFDVSYFPQL